MEAQFTVVSDNLTVHVFLLLAWSRAHKFYEDAATRAEELLKLQLQLGKPDLLGEQAMPDFQSFTITILTHAESMDPDKLDHAKRLLESLLEMVAAGDLQATRNPSAPFSAVLSAAARTPPKVKKDNVAENGFTSVVDTETDPYSIANKIYRHLQNDTYQIGAKVDHHAASAFLRVISQHCAPGSAERENTARIVFEEACEAGEVSRLVIQALHAALGDDVKDLPELQPNKRPKFWSRNVPAAFR